MKTDRLSERPARPVWHLRPVSASVGLHREHQPAGTDLTRGLAEQAGIPLHTPAAPVNRATILHLQRTHGNHYVGQLLKSAADHAVRRCGASPCPAVGPESVDRLPGARSAHGRPFGSTVQRTIGDGHDLTSPRFAGDVRLEACFDNEARLGEGARVNR